MSASTYVRLAAVVAFGAITTSFLGSLCLGTAQAASGDLLVSGYLSNRVHRYQGPAVGLPGECLGIFARPNGPYGMTMGPDFNLYVSSPGGTGGAHTILRFDGTTGTFLDTFVPPEGGLADPKGLAFGPDGNLYVCSSGTDDVKVYDGQTGVHLADLSCAGMDHPNDLAFEPNDPSFLYVVDGGDQPGDAGITRFDLSNGLCDVCAAHGEAGYEGGSFGPDGNLYVLSYYEKSVLVFDRETCAYIRECVPGTGHGSVRGKPVFDTDGNLYLCETDAGHVLCYDPTNGALVRVAASGCQLDGPVYCMFDVGIHAGDLLVSGSWSDAIHRYKGPALDEPGSCVFTDVTSPYCLTYGPDFDLYVGSPWPGPDAILRFDGKTGEPKGSFIPGGSGGLDGPKGFAFGADGKFYVASSNTDSVKSYDGINGQYLGVDQELVAGALLNHPNDVEFGQDGLLYVASGGAPEDHARIVRFDVDTRVYEVFVDYAEADGIEGFSFAPDGNIYAVLFWPTQMGIAVFDGQTGEYLHDCVLPASVHIRGKPVFGAEEYMYVNLHWVDEVWRYDPSTCAFVDIFASGCGLDGPVYSTLVPVIYRGDLNCDGEISFGDINPFVLALTNWTQWQLQYQDCRWENADVNGDGAVDFGDINAFVTLLTN